MGFQELKNEFLKGFETKNLKRKKLRNINQLN